MNAPRQYCTFFLDGHLFGVEVEAVQEVIRLQDVTRVPRAPAVVRGLINLRGQIVTAIDLRAQLGLPPPRGGAPSMNVVMRADGGPVSLLVDEIGDVIEVREDWFEPPPDTLQGTGREMLRGAYKLTDRLLLILDRSKAIHVDAA